MVCNLNGFVYGLPVHKEIAQQATVFFRTDILEKHQIDPRYTEIELTETATVEKYESARR